MLNRNAVVHVALLALLAGVAGAQETLPEPCIKSTLCRGLLEVYEFWQGSDNITLGAFLGQLHEPPGQNVASNGTTWKTDGASVDLAGTANSYLWANGGSGFPVTTSIWVYADAVPSSGSAVTVLSRYDNDRPGPMFRIVNDGAGAKFRFIVRSVDNEQAIAIDSSTTVSTATWYLVVFGFGIAKDANGNPIGNSLFMSVNGASKSYSSTVGFVVNPGSPQFRVGQDQSGFDSPDESGSNYFDGKLNQLAFWGRELTNAEIAALYNGGAGFSYPFVTE